MKKNVLITGGLGAIGLNLVERLQLDFNVIVIDNFSSGSILPMNFSYDNLVVYKADIRDDEKLDEIFSLYSFDTVYHLAANFANQSSVDFPKLDLDVNGRGFLNVILRCDKFGVRRFVYTSSSCVYGGQSGPLCESNKIILDTPYAITKYLGEQYCSYFSSFSSMKIDAYRLFNSYGPGELAGKYRNVIPNFVKSAIFNEDIVITGDGSETRDFTYVSDVVNALILEKNDPFARFRILNVGTGLETSVLELANEILKVTGSSSKILFKERRSWDHVKSRKANSDLLKSYGWLPSVSLAEGLKKYFEWNITI